MTLRTLLGDYSSTSPLRKGEVRSPRLVFEFADVKMPQHAFKQVVRELKFDVAELALVTYLQAKAYGKPLVLLPAVVSGKFQQAWSS
jgi:4,5-dihydroxyphthalate decarboxylase